MKVKDSWLNVHSENEVSKKLAPRRAFKFYLTREGRAFF